MAFATVSRLALEWLRTAIDDTGIDEMLMSRVVMAISSSIL